MSVVIPFPARSVVPADPADDLSDIDLATALDVAIRDLRDIAAGCHGSLRQQADDCRELLERALGNFMAG